MRSRSEVVSLAASWVGKNEADGSFKSIIDIYNSYDGTLPRGTKMLYTWPWCACTWSALAIKLGYTDIMPIEISCTQLITKAKAMGIWKEADSYVPSPGDGILYDWQDSGSGDNTGSPDHIGVVEVVTGNTIVVIEGNYSNAVKRRNLSVNGKYIRGFITPKYDAEASTPIEATTKRVRATYPAMSFLKTLAGSYTVTANCNIRNGSGMTHKILGVVPKGTKVQCYGYYNSMSGANWLYVIAKVGNTEYTGFMSSTYLKK